MKQIKVSCCRECPFQINIQNTPANLIYGCQKTHRVLGALNLTPPDFCPLEDLADPKNILIQIENNPPVQSLEQAREIILKAVDQAIKTGITL
jgi:hypothetical protein